MDVTFDPTRQRVPVQVATRPTLDLGLRLLTLIPAGMLFLVAEVAAAPLSGERLNPVASVVAPIACVVAFALLWLGTRDTPPRWLQRRRARAPAWSRRRIWRAAVVAPLLLWSLVLLFNSARYFLHPTTYPNDAVAYVHADAELALRGVNPYSDNETIWQSALRWNTRLGTPLMRGRFGTCALCYPSLTLRSSVMRDEASNPAHRGPEFDPNTAHNYPAGILWMVMPVIWAGAPYFIWMNFVAALVIGALVLLRAPAAARPALAIALCCQGIAFSTNFDAMSIVFVVAAWHWLDRRRASPLLLGWACAVKQIAWFFVPFYLVEIARREGWRSASRRAGWMALAFFAPNLPFIAANPHAWLASMGVPMSGEMFPSGQGFIALALGGVLPLWPPLIYSLLEFGAWAALVAWQMRRKAVTSDGLLLALMPLFFARRDLINYAALLSLLGLWLAADLLRQRASNPAPLFSSRRRRAPAISPS